MHDGTLNETGLWISFPIHRIIAIRSTRVKITKTPREVVTEIEPVHVNNTENKYYYIIIISHTSIAALFIAIVLLIS